MSTTLANCEILLSQQMADYYSGTTTSAGDSSGTFLIDTALRVKPESWMTDEATCLITSGTYDTVEREIESLDTETGALTFKRPFAGQIATSVTYEIHRLFSAEEKKQALIYGDKSGFPYIHNLVRDETKVLGNWLKDGSFEIWTSLTALTHWTDDGTVILTKTSTSPYYRHGSYSCKLGTAAGYIHQDITNWDDLKHLAGKSVTFTIQGYCATADTLRIAIYDGTTTTYSDYRTAKAAWTEYDDPMEVTATIQDNPTAIEFRIYLATANDAYVDDARVISGTREKIYIGNLGLAQNLPHKVSREQSRYSQSEPWVLIRGTEISGDYLYVNSSLNDYRLRIEGIGYLDFLASGVSSTTWSSTIALDSPQTEILVAEAAVYLWRTRVMPNWTSGDVQEAERALAYWELELRKRRAKYGMPTPSAIINFT